MQDNADSDLLLRIRRVVSSLRNNDAGVSIEQYPRHYGLTDEYINGQRLRKLNIVTLSRGCSSPTCTMCPFTSFNLSGGDKKPHPASMQVARVFSELGDINIDMVSIYNDGSFFSDSEMSELDRIEIADLVRLRGIKHITVESLPNFITTRKVEVFVRHLDGCKVIIGVGLQSSDDFIREVCIGTTVTKNRFEECCAVCAQVEVGIKPYLIIKAPFITDCEAISDIRKSCYYLLSLGIDNATLCPTRIAGNTLVSNLYCSGLFVPPRPITVMLSTFIASRLLKTRVAMANLTGGDFSSITTSSYYSEERDTLSIVNSIKSFNDCGEFTINEISQMEQLLYNKHADINIDVIRRRVKDQLSLIER